ncbi:MAG: hypothetical protein J6Q56_00500 [Clostridia bacterium]|nr:hypothetical protein [Clostridia bacterium]
MKKYQKVVDRVEEYRYKKGIVRIDTTSSLYKTGKIFYIISFAWLMAFLLLYIMGITLQMATGYEIETIVLVSPIVIALMATVGLVLVCIKQHFIALVTNILCSAFNIALFLGDENVLLGIIENGITSKFIWRHFAPSALIILFTLIVCIIGIKTICDFRKDYKKVMNSMYIKFKEENPIASDAEWQSYLEGEENGDA